MKKQKIQDLIDKSRKMIRNERLALGITQKEFADFSGIKYATYRLYEQSGKISLENFFTILVYLNKDIEFDRFLDSFEFNVAKERVRKDKSQESINIMDPIVPPSQKQITLDKEIFGNELFYSVDNGHLYEVSTFISRILKDCNDHRMLLLLKYFGEKRLKPYILKEKNIELLKMFNKHISYLHKKLKKH
jgi:transcriptional regulator with XRE-family HTH domain